MFSVREELSNAILRRIRARHKPRLVRSIQSGERLPLARAHLREASFSDFTQVAELKERSGLSPDSIQNWERLWRQNPAVRQTDLQQPIGWVLEADRKIVGYLGSIPIECYFGNRRLTAVAAHGFVVDQAYRALAISLAGAFYSQKGIDLFLSTSAIEATGKLALLFKSARLPQADYDTVFFWILHPHAFARVVADKLQLPPVISGAGCLGLSLLIQTQKLFRKAPRRDLPQRITVDPIRIEALGQEFLDLWRGKIEEERRLFADRRPETLKWHFQIPGDQGSVVVLGCYRDKTLHGYAIVRTDTDRKNRLRKSLIADILVRANDPDLTRALLIASYELASRNGSDVLEVQGFPARLRAVFSEFRPYSRKYPACPYYFKAADPGLQRELGNSSSWYACPYDGDATLIRPSYSSISKGPDQEVGSVLGKSFESPQFASPILKHTQRVID